MTDYLVYWKTFWSDVDDPQDVSHDWRTKSESFYKRVEHGDNLWVVVSGGLDNPDEWRLLHRIFVDRRDPVLQKSPWGPYHIIGDARKIQLFDPNFHRDVTPILKKLKFTSGRRITLSGRQIGQQLENQRPLTASDIMLL